MIGQEIEISQTLSFLPSISTILPMLLQFLVLDSCAALLYLSPITCGEGYVHHVMVVVSSLQALTATEILRGPHNHRRRERQDKIRHLVEGDPLEVTTLYHGQGTRCGIREIHGQSDLLNLWKTIKPLNSLMTYAHQWLHSTLGLHKAVAE